MFGFRDLLWVSVGQYFIFGALCPFKSGLMNKHIVKHIAGLPVYWFKSGLINKHTVKHTGISSQAFTCARTSKSEMLRNMMLLDQLAKLGGPRGGKKHFPVSKGCWATGLRKSLKFRDGHKIAGQFAADIPGNTHTDTLGPMDGK